MNLHSYRAVAMSLSLVLPFATALAADTPSPAAPPPVYLTNAAQVRALKTAEAARHLPVRLRGVVIGEAEAGGEGFAIHDGTSGVYLRSSPIMVSKLQPGDLLEIEGTSDPGQFAPFVVLKSFRKLGTEKIPEPRHVTLDELAGGGLDAQWVEISGIVRYCEPPRAGDKKCTMEIATGGGRLIVRLNIPKLDAALVDSRVRLRGVCYYLVNKNRQSLSPLLSVPHTVPVVVETAAPVDGFAAAVRSVGSLMQFSPEGPFGHRVHVRGLVTCQSLGEFWIKDNALGLRIQSAQEGALHPGDEVDVLGFPRQGEYTPLLEDAVYRIRSRQAPPVPVALSKAEQAYDHDADLVTLEGTLMDRQPAGNGWTFVFQTDDGTLFPALLHWPRGLAAPNNFRNGSRLRVAGLCSVIREYTGPHTGMVRPQSFQLLLRSQADLSLIRLPSWWTRQHIVWLLSAATSTLLLSMAGVMAAARWRLQKQAAQRRMAEAEFSAILSERNRVAREIHDTLAQGLGAISLHLGLVQKQLANAPIEVKRHLDLAYNVARASLADARHAIFGMRSQVLENGDLPAALEGILQQMTEGTNVTGHLSMDGRPRRLPPTTENALLRIGQEAITNAARHARPKQIHVQLEFAEKQVRLSVKDDGCGFDPGRSRPAAGNFGLVGMRERAVQLHGELVVHSEFNVGTKITFTAPAPS
jgi:signal transduction histidine kinase